MKIKNITIKKVNTRSTWTWKLKDDRTNVIILMSECEFSTIDTTSIFCNNAMIDLSLYINTKRTGEKAFENAIRTLKGTK